ncbi:hypothetical protein AZI86_18555 [Bdellovibrio bacteriovorus]|uniref:Uncharacterized protein n=1 Tax=Bdellovibrio bacteriovorus TaxID=959 RepID=A0A150WFP8_BDEBC|nr:hypothetical protein [Bdellovibrio bacteriovorus]KYG61695.1 hypothetical protein AZI86_18555 [Bdellovibrio bacteriovorus]
MKIFSFSPIIGLTFLALATQAADKPQCNLAVLNPKPPQVTIYPESGLTNGDEVQIEFNQPTLSANGNDKKRFLKIKDVDGSITLMNALYLVQNDETLNVDLEPVIYAALKKRLAYWEEDLRKQNSKPPITPNSGVDPILVETSVATNRMLLKDGKKVFNATERKAIYTDVLGPMTDYDQNFKYEYREFMDGKYVSQGAKRLADILPAEFYNSASSTKYYGVIQDKANAGKTNCEYLPVTGRLPKAGDVRTIQRPGQGQR